MSARVSSEGCPQPNRKAGAGCAQGTPGNRYRDGFGAGLGRPIKTHPQKRQRAQKKRGSKRTEPLGALQRHVNLFISSVSPRLRELLPVPSEARSSTLSIFGHAGTEFCRAPHGGKGFHFGQSDIRMTYGQSGSAPKMGEVATVILQKREIGGVVLRGGGEGWRATMEAEDSLGVLCRLRAGWQKFVAKMTFTTSGFPP